MREASVAGDVARVRIATAGGAGGLATVGGGATAATAALASGRGTETATALDVSGSAPPSPAARERLWPPGANVGGIITNCPEASAVASATVLPASLSSTFALGTARPAMTASPVGWTVTTSKDGLALDGASALAAAACSAGSAPAGGAAVRPAGAAGGTAGAAGSGARASTGALPGPGHTKSGCVQTSAPVTATNAAPAAPTQISIDCEGMYARFHSRLYANKRLATIVCPGRRCKPEGIAMHAQESATRLSSRAISRRAEVSARLTGPLVSA